MKKLILLLLSFAFSSEAFANLDGVPLENQKKYLLAVTTSLDGEYEIGKRPYRTLLDRTPTFYISTKKCQTEKCVQFYGEALKSAIAFANDYNELVGEKVVSVSDKFSRGGIPIYLVERLSSFGRWNCKYRGGRLKNCHIKVRVNGNDHAGETVAHEMLNVLGIQDTRQSAFKGCLSYDDSRNYTPDYEGLCEIEQKAIVFAYKHLRPGMKKGAVEKVFDRHWQGFDFASVVNAN